jgi:hypothetical protein
MKWLKTYESHHKLSDDIIQNLKDICLELTDQGFGIAINSDLPKSLLSSPPFSNKINLTILKSSSNGNKEFLYKEISEVVERISDFMDSRGYKSVITPLSLNVVGSDFEGEHKDSIKLSRVYICFVPK